MTKKAKIIKASKLLQAKVGTGTIDEAKIQEISRVMEANEVDFPQMASELLERITATLTQARQGENDGASYIPTLTSTVMQIKSNSGMFGYPLISSISALLLDFLEEINKLDQAVFDLTKTYDTIVRILINDKNISQDSPQGQLLQKELKDACMRYFKKTGINPTSPTFR